jgi:hypothetical protein
MKLIHGSKAKNDRIDAGKIARLLKGGNFPLSYAYPKGMRETRDLLRRRMYLVHKRAELITHLVLAPRLPSRRAGIELRPLLERDRVVLHSRRGERMIFEGAGQCVCRRLAQAKGRPTSTVISCLVQPRGCNPLAKKAVQTKRYRSTGSEGNDKKEEKNLLRRRSVY